MIRYIECVKTDDVLIKDLDPTNKFLCNIPSIGKIGQESYGNKQRVQVLLDRDVLILLRDIIGPLVTDPTLIFRALVAHKYKSQASYGWAALHGP